MVWEARTGKLVQSLDPHGEEAHGVSFSPDGKKLASSAYDGVVRVRDIATGRDVWDPTVSRLVARQTLPSIASVWDDASADPPVLPLKGT